MREKLLFPFILLAAFILSGCQTSMLKQFQQVSMGMEKADVLELMGSPRDTQRFHGKDRWKYVFYDDKIRFDKEVHFLDGAVIYVGDIWQPSEELSAVAIDKKNEEAEKHLQQQTQKTAEETAKNSSYDQYRSKVKGEDKIRYLPEFEAVR